MIRESLLNSAEAADWLGVSQPSLRRLVRAGRLPKIKIGGATRFRSDDIRALIERGVVVPSKDEGPAATQGLLIEPPAVQGQHDPT